MNKHSQKQHVTGSVNVSASVDKRGHVRKQHVRTQQLLAKYEKAGHIISPRFDAALTMATQAHDGQVRKGAKDEHGNPVPYITHPVAVAALVAKYGGDEDQAIAGMLHDVLEDGGPQWVHPILSAFGPRVLSIVEACTDGKPDASGKKALWLERKTSYLYHLLHEHDDALLVSACDKLHNITAIHDDLMATGPGVFDRFSSSREQTLWYYRRLSEIFAMRKIAPANAIANQYKQIIDRLK